jgi:ankyrin repeat protein
VEGDLYSATSVCAAAWISTADILQLLLDGGGSVNEPDNEGITPLIALVRNYNGDVPARLGILLARPELDLDAKWQGKTAEQWAVSVGRLELAAAIAAERGKRQRWSVFRSAWVAAIATPAAFCEHTCVSYSIE